ncbi:LutB/LldF family L-lactate oxidation iron-sulfur protein [Taklimakanibacter deserti]|uniref:LutB/LldF family L-lactate oxidation iron-sulfur protein n=1 Tax=Taklimakanibacter deserti TaxID=2267839 RepID=UPI000E65E0DD
MEQHASEFPANVKRAIADSQLQSTMTETGPRFIEKRAKARANLPEFDALRDQARDIKDHVLAHLDLYLERYEAKVVETGGHVHWAETAEEARAAILSICKRLDAKLATKGKSMISEEIGLNPALEAAHVTPVETDLGEYLIQIRGEAPSHIIAPAVHLTRDQIEADFRKAHTHLDPNRDLTEIPTLVEEARQVLRQKYLDADVGITGANFLISETGTSIIVTNEGNGDLTQTLPRAHIVIASIEKVVPTLEDATTILRVLARSATGQDFSNYTTFSTGPRRADDPDGPLEYHVVILDNGRSNVLGTEFQDMLRCIRCGACLNHCPVYQAVGGHAYGWVYPGPIGSVVTPALIGIEKAKHLPNASTFCGRCEEVCPMRIPLPRLLRHWREKEFEKHLTPGAVRWGLGVWAYFAKRPKLYQFGTRIAARLLHVMGRRKGRFTSLPLAQGWTQYRDMPAPQGKTFQAMWKERARG